MSFEFIEQNIYNKIIEKVPIVCVDVAIVHAGKILLIKRKDEPEKGSWWLPGGRLYKNEFLRDCAHRKALEEVGLKCYVGPNIYTQETIFQTGPSGIPVSSVNFVYLLSPIGSVAHITLDEHSEEYQWVDKVGYYNEYVRTCLQKAGLI